ncbi:TetR/AcrR family transcriptional regulator [Salinibacterium sp. dk2585]|uniref:TetR/AcrR family transcriptional regulator n=1 Tax=unclassified Salinibacterium TaxID=2632331 RepID=UPI0011C25598|nr:MULTISPECIES: TetR/AcrR family transcriptional regulator [unclassified Salinibacterium]QEE60714.1 TetR/AcrR family transcriptional regulator [Salinibacterium sp. dk2585]TXK55786.1 TetR/AcrR family transcriptional regulator [Salinibacterium sp. dk5596]
MTVETPAPKVSRRQQLVQVALEVLERDGFAHLSIGEVARRAGIKPPSLYKQFASKADIEDGVVEHGLQLMVADFERCLEQMPPDAAPAERLRRLLATFREFGLEHPQLYLLMNSKPFEAQQAASQTTHAAARMFVSAVSDLLRSPESEVAVTAVWTWAHGILSQEIVGRVHRPDATWDMLVETVASMRG